MATKPHGKSWREVQMAIAAISVTATLGFWNFFSTPDKSLTAASQAPTATPPEPPLPTETLEPTATAPVLALRPIKIIYGGQAPQQQVIQVAAAPAPKKQRNSGGGGGGGTTVTVKPPTTGTSK